jgi:GT2 family glycosyltransferase
MGVLDGVVCRVVLRPHVDRHDHLGMDLPVTRASIIIPTINARPDLLDMCVRSVEPTLTADDELLVVDGGTFAENCNRGAAEATGDYLIFLNDDTKVDQDDWLDLLLGPFSDPQVGVAGCRLIYPNGQIQHAGVYFTIEEEGLRANNRTWDCPSGPVESVTGACMAVRSDVYRDLGGLDPEYRNGYEDIDFCLRVLQAGHLIHYVADCTLIHHESQSGAARWEYVGDNVHRFVTTWTVTDPAV